MQSTRIYWKLGNFEIINGDRGRSMALEVTLRVRPVNGFFTAMKLRDESFLRAKALGAEAGQLVKRERVD
jgi:hypothetical protein